MKKSDLKTGMYAEFSKTKRLRLVQIGTENGDVTCEINAKVCNYHTGFNRLYDNYDLGHLDDNLKVLPTYPHDVLGDIIKVYGVYGKLLWERSEEIKAPVVEVSECIVDQVREYLGDRFEHILTGKILEINEGSQFEYEINDLVWGESVFVGDYLVWNIKKGFHATPIKEEKTYVFGEVKEYCKGDIVVWNGNNPAICRLEGESDKVYVDNVDCYTANGYFNSLHIDFLRHAYPDEIRRLGNETLIEITREEAERENSETEENSGC